MKSRIAGIFVALSVTAVAASAAPTPPPPKPPALSKWQQAQQATFNNSAPADEYFGKMKLSYLGMNNTFRDAAISSGDHTTDPGIINKVSLAEDALEAWAKKYPRDPQLARTYFLATQVDRKIWTKANQEHAWFYLNRLIALFPDSYFGKVLKKDLTIGFTEHYYALPVPCSTPSPSPTPSADATPGSPFAIPTPVAAPTDTPSPEPSPTPVITTAGKGHNIEVIPQACVPPATPSPSPSPSPTPTPTPSPSPTDSPAVPAASASPSPAATST